MQRTEAAGIAESLGKFPRLWNRFWFAAMDARVVGSVKQSFAVLVGMMFLNGLFWAPQWLSADGWFGLQAGRYFIGQGMPDTGSQYRWSILYWLSTPGVAQALCIGGMLSCLAMFLGVGGRAAVILAWACLMMLHHRAPWLTLSAEYLACAGLFYLVIAPQGKGATGTLQFRRKSENQPTTEPSVLANLSLRCLQVHWLIWIGLSLASMFAQNSWWDGTALAVLSEQGSGWLGKLTRESWTSQILGFLLIALHFSTLLCLSNRALRGLGILLTVALGGAWMILASDWLLGLTACCYGLAFAPYTDKETPGL